MSIISYLRSFRIFQIALFDLITAFFGLLLLVKLLFKNKPQSFYISWTIVLLLPISVLSHILVNQPTMLNFYLGLSKRPKNN